MLHGASYIAACSTDPETREGGCAEVESPLLREVGQSTERVIGDGEPRLNCAGNMRVTSLLHAECRWQGARRSGREVSIIRVVKDRFFLLSFSGVQGFTQSAQP